MQIIGDEYGIVHRDIKPENVLFFKRGQAAVSDLGIANFVDAAEPTLKFTQKSGALTQYGSFVGTVPYAAPEQLVGTSPLDQGVDIWAFGILLYEMVTGTLPFTGESIEDLACSIMTGPVPGLDKITKHCGKPVAHVIKKCLRKTRSARYGNFHDLIRDWDKVIRFSSSPKVGIFGKDTRFFIDEERIEFQFLRFFPQRQSEFEARVNLSAINRCLEAGDLRRIGKPAMALDSCRIALETVVNGRTNLDRLLAHELGDKTEWLEWREESSNEVTARYVLPTEGIAEGALYTAMCCYVDIIEDMKSDPSKLGEKDKLLAEFLALCDRVKNGTYHSDRLMLM